MRHDDDGRSLSRWQVGGFVVATLTPVVLSLAGIGQVDSITLGLLLAALVQLIELQRRSTESASRILGIYRVNQLLAQDRELFREVSLIAESYLKVRDLDFELFKRRAAEALSECSSIISGMAKGHLAVPDKNPYSYLYEPLGEAKSEVRAVDVGEHKGWWDSVRGRKYLEVNLEAVNRGVKITRIFLGSRSAILDRLNFMKEQARGGIEILAATTDDISVALNDDYIISDNRVAIQVNLTGDGRARERNVLIDQSEIGRLISQFETLKSQCYTLADFEDLISEEEKGVAIGETKAAEQE